MWKLAWVTWVSKSVHGFCVPHYAMCTFSRSSCSSSSSFSRIAGKRTRGLGWLILLRESTSPWEVLTARIPYVIVYVIVWIARKVLFLHAWMKHAVDVVFKRVNMQFALHERGHTMLRRCQNDRVIHSQRWIHTWRDFQTVCITWYEQHAPCVTLKRHLTHVVMPKFLTLVDFHHLKMCWIFLTL